MCGRASTAAEVGSILGKEKEAEMMKISAPSVESERRRKIRIRWVFVRNVLTHAEYDSGGWNK